MSKHSSRWALVALGVCAAVAIATGVGLAAIPDEAGIISGCYVKRTGELRVVDAEAGAECKKSERAISWAAGGGIRSPGDLAGTPCAIGDRSGETILAWPAEVTSAGYGTAFQLGMHCAVPDAFEPNDSQAAAADLAPFNFGDMLDHDATVFPAGDDDWYVADEAVLANFCVYPAAATSAIAWEVYKDGVLVASKEGDDCYAGDVLADWTFHVSSTDPAVYHFFVGV